MSLCFISKMDPGAWNQTKANGEEQSHWDPSSGLWCHHCHLWLCVWCVWWWLSNWLVAGISKHCKHWPQLISKTLSSPSSTLAPMFPIYWQTFLFKTLTIKSQKLRVTWFICRETRRLKVFAILCVDTRTIWKIKLQCSWNGEGLHVCLLQGEVGRTETSCWAGNVTEIVCF